MSAHAARRHLVVCFSASGFAVETKRISPLCKPAVGAESGDYEGSTTILIWESSPVVRGSVTLNDLPGVVQVDGCKISIRIFPWTEFQEHGRRRQQVPANLSATFALPQ
jgi:hypothetical protein